MKIGILTFHNVPNYGAVLQAFALKSFVEKNFDAKTFIVDYKCVGNDDSFKNIKQSFYKINNVLKRIYKIAQFDFYIGRKYDYKIIKFEDFKKSYLSVSELKDTLKDFDVILCGSDQIWNPRITNGFQDVYFGVKKPKTTKYISYAASCGDISEFSVQEKENLLRLV